MNTTSNTRVHARISLRSPAAAASMILAIASCIACTPGSSTRVPGKAPLPGVTMISVEPASGTIEGGTTIIVRGTEFRADTAPSLSVGGKPAADFAVIDAATITARTPAGETTGAVDVVLTDSRGSVRLANAFRYVVTVEVDSLTPTAGSSSGGLTVTLLGSGFTTATDTEVWFGGEAASGVTVLDTHRMTVVTPVTAQRGAVDIRVRNGNGDLTLNSAFLYLAPLQVSAVSPAQGPVGGGTAVLVSGEGFSTHSGAIVSFGDRPAASVTVYSGATMVATAPAALAAGSVDVRVLSGGNEARLSGAFSYVSGVVVTKAEPAAGALSGGQTVTITGAGFTNSVDTVVSFGGQAASQAAVLNANTLTCRAPAASAEGRVNLTVTNSTGSFTLVGGYQYTKALSLQGLSPAQGPQKGGTSVVIQGEGFTSTGDVSVSFGVAGAASVVVLDSRTLSCKAPAQASQGAVNVSVSASTGSATLANAFTYKSLVEVSGIIPASSSLSGGVAVTISGLGFSGGTAPTVRFGDAGATNVTVIDDATIQATTPRGANFGAVHVTVSTDNGAATLPNGFSYVNGVSLAGVTPASGPLAGGTLVTITGSGFTSAADTALRFGDQQALSLAVLNATTMTAIAPQGAALGAVSVSVSTGNGSAGAANVFTYQNSVTLDSVSPAAGPLAGGMTVTVRGTNFTAAGDSLLFFGDRLATSLSVLDAQTMAATVPASSTEGFVTVRLENAAGKGAKADGYRYKNGAVVVAVSPASGPLAGGGTVTITGAGFLGAATPVVRFGQAAATNVIVAGDTSLTGTVPASSVAGSVDVLVSGGQGSSTFSGGYSYVTSTAVSSVSPAQGALDGQTRVLIRGQGFTSSADMTVSFGGSAATSLQVLDAGTLTVLTPAHAAGLVDVVVTTGAAAASFTSTGAFTFTPVVEVASVTPKSGALAGGQTVTISGRGFSSGAVTVMFGSQAGLSVAIVGDTSLTVVVPPASAVGAIGVTVTSGAGSATLSNGFRYVTGVTISGVSPSQGGLAGGESLVISGSGFTGVSDTTVRFGSVSAALSSVPGAQTMVVTAPPSASAATVDLTVSNANGTAILAGAYEYRSLLSLSGLSVASGPQMGGASVTIAGTGFTNAADSTVTFGGRPVSMLSVSSATAMTVTVPPGEQAGAVDVKVVNSQGSALLAGAFTYLPGLSVSAVMPAGGPANSANALSLLGTGFTTDADTSLTLITSGGPVALNAGSDFTVVSSTLITLTTPATIGAESIGLALVNSHGSVTRSSAYAFTTGMAVTGVSPASGPLSGGTVVTVSGSGFGGATTVLFGGVAGTNVTVTSATAITVTTPQGISAGQVNVTVDVTGGETAALQGGFEYRNSLRLFTVNPSSGSVSGGNVVQFTGQGFTSAADMTLSIGGSPVSALDVRSSTLATGIVPAGAAGSANVAATSALLSSNDAIASGYNYQNTLTLTTLSPKAGGTGGGAVVTVTGRGFTTTAATTVTWGGAALTAGGGAPGSFTVVNNTVMTMVAPAHAAGSVDLTVSNANGGSTLPAAFSYVTSVTLSSIVPADGPLSGGSVVTLTGSGFTSAADLTVKFRDASATGVTVASATSLQVTVPPGDALTAVSVSVQSASLGSSATLNDAYTYINPVTIDAISPASGPTTGGTAVTITGAGFVVGDTVVAFGPAEALSVNVTSATSLSAVAPPIPGLSAQTVNVAVSNSQGAAVKSAAYAYVQAVSITSVSPASGPLGGGTTLTITGNGFTSASDTTLSIGGKAGTDLAVLSPSQISVKSPAAANTGAVAVTISNGLGAASLANAFSYTNGVGIAALSPSKGSVYGGITVTITGSGFTTSSDTAVRFASQPAVNVAVINATTLTCVTPAGSFPGTVNVQVQNGNGSAEKVAGYLYDRSPVIFGTSPDRLRLSTPFGTALNNRFHVFGAGFLGSGVGTEVLLGATNYDDVGGSGATRSLSVDANGAFVSLVDTVGLSNSGPISITLTNPNGTASYTGLFVVGQFQEDSVAVITDPSVLSTSVTSADFNGDGFPDLFVTNGAGEQDRLFLNVDLGGGVRGLQDATVNLPALLNDSRDAVAGDFDQDGDLDIVVAVFNGPLVFLKNNGAALFSDDSGPRFSPNPGYAVQAIGASDYNNDGDLDLILCCNGQNQSYRWFSGRFNRSTDGTYDDLPNDSADTRAVTFADFNGDNRTDLVFANFGSPNVLLLGDSGDSFQPPSTPAFSTAAPLDDDPTTDVLVLDVDGINGPDLILIENGASDPNRILINDGSGKFTLDAGGRMPTDAALDFSHHATPADLDNDGDTDLFVCTFDVATVNTGNQPNRVLTNDGAGFFTLDANNALPDLSAGYLAAPKRDHTPDAVAFDLDQDGDLDLYMANGDRQTTAEDTPNYLLRNKTVP